MKKLLAFVSFIMVGALQAQVVTNKIECAPGLDPSLKNRFELQVNKPKSHHKKALGHVHVSLNTFLNDIPVETKSSMHFDQPVSSDDVHQQLRRTVDGHQKNAQNNPVGELKDGIVSCQFKMDDEPAADIVATSQHLGIIYQCPLPQNVKVIDAEDTKFIIIKAHPRCTRAGMNPKECGEYATALTLEDESLLERAPGNAEYYYYNSAIQPTEQQRQEYPASAIAELFPKKLYYDRTARGQKVPMRFTKHAIKTFQFKGDFGPGITVQSQSVDKAMEMRNGKRIATGVESHSLNQGIGVDKENRAIDQFGQLVLNNCKETKLEKNNDRMILSCHYGPVRSPQAIVLKADITHDIDLAKAKFYGASAKDGIDPLRALTGNTKSPLRDLTRMVQNKASLVIPSYRPQQLTYRQNGITRSVVREHFLAPPFMVVAP